MKFNMLQGLAHNHAPGLAAEIGIQVAVIDGDAAAALLQKDTGG